MELSKRLEAVASMVSRGNRLADVGTDHGYIPIALVEKGWIPSAIAMDINKGPLERAGLHIRTHGLEDKITTRLSNGLEMLSENEADTIVIAGMGGPLIQNILSAGKKTADSVSEFVLQPQSEIGKVRHYLEEHGYEILDENMVEEDGKFYPMMKVRHGRMHYETEAEYRYGHFLLHSQNPVLHKYLKKEKETLMEVLSHLKQADGERAKQAKIEVEEKLQIAETAGGFYHEM